MPRPPSGGPAAAAERSAVEAAEGRLALCGRRCLVGGLFLAPVLVNLRAGPSFSTSKLAVLWVAGLGAMGFSVASCVLRRRSPPASRLGAAAIAYCAAAALSTAFSLSPRLSLVGLYGRYGGLLPLLLYVGIMHAVVALHWDRPAALRAVLAAVGASSSVVAVSVLLQQAGIDRVLWAGPVMGGLLGRPGGTLGNSNFAGAQLGIGLPALWYLLVSANGALRRSAVLAAIGLVAAALWFTQSRGGMLAGLVGLGVMAASTRRRRSTWPKRAAAIAVGATLVVAAVVLLRPSGEGSPAGDVGVLRTETLRSRLSYWGVAARVFWAHPVIGTGLDTFYAYYPQLRTAPRGGLPAASAGVEKPDNVLLEHASDSGAAGALTYLAVVGLALQYARRRLRALHERDRLLLSAFLGLLCAYLAQALFSIDVPATAVLGWVAIGGVAVLADPRIVLARVRPAPGESAASQLDRSGRHPAVARIAFCVSMGATAVWLGAMGLRPVEAEVAMNAGRAGEAIRLDPLNSDLRLRAGFDAKAAADEAEDPAQQRELLGRARDLYLESLKLKPRDPLAMARLAELETAWASRLDPSHFAEAERWWRRALVSDPGNRSLRRSFNELPGTERRTVTRLEAEASARADDVGSHLRLAKAYVALDEREKARSTLSLVLELDPGNEDAAKLLASLQ